MSNTDPKWPKSITLIRHGESAYNVLRHKKEKDALYRAFKKAFEKDHTSVETKVLAEKVRTKFALNVSDYATPLTDEGWRQSMETGKGIREVMPIPDIVLCSPYLRTKRTLDGINLGSYWRIDPKIVIMDDRVREQEHGLSLLYNDSRVFQTFHPEQKSLKDLLGNYWYQYPQGESVAEVRDRIRLMTDTIIREYSGLHVLIITHHLTILSIRANFERMSPEQFLEIDEKEKPINCGVTMYKCNPNKGSKGKLELEFYNRRFY